MVEKGIRGAICHLVLIMQKLKVNIRKNNHNKDSSNLAFRCKNNLY